MSDVANIRSLSERLLATPLPRRWSHVVSLANRAAKIESDVGFDTELVAAAWAHDIGYSPAIAHTGFHPVDGARFLRQVGVCERIVGLVAYHSSAATEAKFIGCSGALAEFKDEPGLTRDLLWYLDMTTGPDGEFLSFSDRMSEIRRRYAPDHYVIRALDLGMPERTAAIERAEAWMSQVGLLGQV